AARASGNRVRQPCQQAMAGPSTASTLKPRTYLAPPDDPVAHTRLEIVAPAQNHEPTAARRGTTIASTHVIAHDGSLARLIAPRMIARVSTAARRSRGSREIIQLRSGCEARMGTRLEMPEVRTTQDVKAG